MPREGFDGWYYLHINGDVIYRRELGETAADIRESDLAVGMWPMDPEDREGAWRICVEALAGGVPRDVTEKRVKELADKWGLTNEDAQVYARRINAKLWLDGNSWCAAREDFVDVQSSPCGFGDTALEALAALAKELGYKPTKMWGASFADLVNARK